MLSIKKWFHHGASQGIELKSHCPELNCKYDFIQKINPVIKGWCGDQSKGSILNLESFFEGCYVVGISW